jgi:hypothetical protein
VNRATEPQPEIGPMKRLLIRLAGGALIVLGVMLGANLLFGLSYNA